MIDQVLAFLADLDTTLAPLAGGQRLDLYHVGGSALALRHRSTRVTADVDVIPPTGSAPLLGEAVRLFGRDTPKAREHDLYLEEVSAALPPAPAGFRNRATEFAGGWAVIRLFHLDPHDLICTKLRRYATKDREDIRLLCDTLDIGSELLQTRLRLAWHSEKDEDDGDPEQTRTFLNLRRVQAYLRGDATDL